MARGSASQGGTATRPARRVERIRLRGARGGATVAGAALLSAVLLWSASPSAPAGAGWLAWGALVPVAAVALRWPGTRGARVAVPLAYGLYLELLLVPALPFGLAEGHWGEPPIPVMIGDSPVLVVAGVAVPLLALALYGLRFGQPWLVTRAPAGASIVPALLAPALAWTVLDFARVQLDPGAYFGVLFITQHDTAALRLSALGGPWLLTLAIALVNYAIALTIVALSRGGTRAAVVPAAVAGGLGASLAAAIVAAAPEGRPPALTVAGVQPGFNRVEYGERFPGPLREGDDDLAALSLIRDLGELTEEAAAQGAELVVWPEATVWVDPRREPAVRTELRALAGEADVALVVPYFLDRSSSGATVVVSADGAVSLPQPKQRPMWFLGEQEGEEPASAPATARGARLGTLLGVDHGHPAVARRLAERGASVIASSTHDWKQLAVIQRAFSRLNATATGTPLVRSDWRFGAAVFGADGRVAADTGPGRSRGVAVAGVAEGGRTLYVAVGDLVAWCAVAGVAVLCLLGAVRIYRRATASRGNPQHVVARDNQSSTASRMKACAARIARLPPRASPTPA